MAISISNAVIQTQIFILLFLLVLLLSIKKRLPFHFDNSLTEELKGFAMLAIIFSHIGYFLIADHRFLYPLSVAAGVGVNLFLFLSGYGLTVSSLNKKLSTQDFYLKRLLKLFIPLWIVLGSFIITDFFIFHKIYSVGYIIQSFAGIYLTSNPAIDIDSPLWYFTLIFFFYLIFPLIFRKSRPLLSGLIILVVTWGLLQIPLPLHGDNVYLYKLHFLAFPLGVIFASLRQKFKWQPREIWRFSLIILLSLIFGYLAINSGVGENEFKEQAISVVSIFLILGIFLLKNIQFRLLNLVGKYSYEIYLLHWPIMFRFENWYAVLPPFLATTGYLIEFLILSFLLQKFSQKLFFKNPSPIDLSQK